MERNVGTISRGIRCPIIREGDDLAKIVVDSVLTAGQTDGFEVRDRDIVCVTESVVARSQGNYASVDAIAADVKAKLGGETIGVIFPILSRNRFAICLRGIAKGAKKIVLMLSYPSDEVGNELVSLDRVDEAGVNPYSDVLTLEKYRELFGENKHPFTGVDYVQYYGDLIRECGAEVEIIFANQAKTILDYTKNVLTCDIHTRARTKRILKANGAEVVCGLDDILTESVDGSGFNSKYGLLGSNKATEDSVKLFPEDGQPVVDEIQAQLKEKTGKNVEVMIYGDGNEHNTEVAQKSMQLLEARHRVTGQGVVLVQSFSDQLSQITSIIDVITIFIVLVASIALLVGGIGVMNIMLVSVTERTREIGIRKALGARTRCILLQFLFESAIITLLGGIIGIILGSLGAVLVCSLIGFHAKISVTTVIVATLFSSAVGIFFGIYPAKRAAKLSPIEALRHE